MVLPRQACAGGSLGNTSEQNNFCRCSQEVNKENEKIKLNFDFSLKKFFKLQGCDMNGT